MTRSDSTNIHLPLCRRMPAEWRTTAPQKTSCMKSLQWTRHLLAVHCFRRNLQKVRGASQDQYRQLEDRYRASPRRCLSKWCYFFDLQLVSFNLTCYQLTGIQTIGYDRKRSKTDMPSFRYKEFSDLVYFKTFFHLFIFFFMYRMKS